ncbi:hypothetical protein T484DRAFT_2667099 [Baffinella frigidus]|nr:hypothetical protein T484DRAFT_2667099 [Cryptophyta sp. CCMP2293]
MMQKLQPVSQIGTFPRPPPCMQNGLWVAYPRARHLQPVSQIGTFPRPPPCMQNGLWVAYPRARHLHISLGFS